MLRLPVCLLVLLGLLPGLVLLLAVALDPPVRLVSLLRLRQLLLPPDRRGGNLTALLFLRIPYRRIMLYQDSDTLHQGGIRPRYPVTTPVVDTSLLTNLHNHPSSSVRRCQDPPESIGRGGWSEFSQLLDIAHPEYRDFLVELGFGPFLSIRYVHVRHPLVRCWVERFFHHTGTIHLSTCEVGVLPVDWSAILGIRFGGRIPPSDPVSDFEALEILGIDDPAAIVGKKLFYLKISYLRDLLVREMEEPPTELRYRQWTAYFIFSCFLGNDKSSIPTPIVGMFRDIDDLRDYDWGALTYGFYIRGLRRFSRRETASFLGFWQFTLFWAFEHFAVFAPSRLPAAPDSAFPLARRWDSAWIQRLTTRTLMECRTTVDCIRDVDIVFQPYSTFLLERPEVFRAMELSRLRICVITPFLPPGFSRVSARKTRQPEPSRPVPTRAHHLKYSQKEGPRHISQAYLGGNVCAKILSDPLQLGPRAKTLRQEVHFSYRTQLSDRQELLRSSRNLSQKLTPWHKEHSDGLRSQDHILRTQARLCARPVPLKSRQRKLSDGTKNVKIRHRELGQICARTGTRFEKKRAGSKTHFSSRTAAFARRVFPARNKLIREPGCVGKMMTPATTWNSRFADSIPPFDRNLHPEEVHKNSSDTPTSGSHNSLVRTPIRANFISLERGRRELSDDMPHDPF
uniref:Aminotransferase-like plant mobile domain-containing protein n=1 Tax=Fagus sylvatica TaxID=28930 RepID=A0A2N9I400_FAGSY